MSKLTFEVSCYKCAVELSLEQFKKLEELDYLDFVMHELQKVGGYDIEYNGHFGAAIYFTSDNLDDAQKVTECIEKMLK